MLSFPSLETYRETQLHNHRQWQRFSRSEGRDDSLEEAMFAIEMNALDAAERHVVPTDVLKTVREAMKKQDARGKSRMLNTVSIPHESPLWLELSPPLPRGYSQYGGAGPIGMVLQQTPIIAMWWNCLAVVKRSADSGPQQPAATENLAHTDPKRWGLTLISSKGERADSFHYFVMSGQWELTHSYKKNSNGNGRCVHMDASSPGHDLQSPGVSLCKRCDDYLKNWSNLFRTAILLL